MQTSAIGSFAPKALQHLPGEMTSLQSIDVTFEIPPLRPRQIIFKDTEIKIKIGMKLIMTVKYSLFSRPLLNLMNIALINSICLLGWNIGRTSAVCMISRMFTEASARATLNPLDLLSKSDSSKKVPDANISSTSRSSGQHSDPRPAFYPRPLQEKQHP